MRLGSVGTVRAWGGRAERRTCHTSTGTGLASCSKTTIAFGGPFESLGWTWLSSRMTAVLFAVQVGHRRPGGFTLSPDFWASRKSATALLRLRSRRRSHVRHSALSHDGPRLNGGMLSLQTMRVTSQKLCWQHHGYRCDLSLSLSLSLSIYIYI